MKEIENIAKWYRLDMKAVNEAEQRMGFSFPKSLRTVYQKYGYGSETDKILFFEVNEGVYISIGINDEKIYFMNEIIAYDLSEFLFKISENPDYWCE